jgi:hypothetical protein
MSQIISKSKYVAGLQCPLLLWYIYNRPDQLPPIDAERQMLFDQGHLIGEYAKLLFPDGVQINHNNSFSAGLQSTQAALKNRQPIFEGAFCVDDLYARADILVPSGATSWDLIEVKSSTGIKDENYLDVAFQYHVYSQAGLKLDRVYLLYLNKHYLRLGKLDLSQLFVKSDLTADIKDKYLRFVPEKIAELRKIIDTPTPPEKELAPHCLHPYECHLKPECWKSLPEKSVLTLYHDKERGFELLKNGIAKLADIPEDLNLNEKQNVQVRTVKNGQPFIDIEAIKRFLGTLRYPVSYLDFETFQSPIPLFEHTKPYQQIPFQFSLHLRSGPGEELQHFSFLADGNNDPRPAFLAELKKLLGASGSIVAYFAPFELGRLKECAEAFPEYAEWINSLTPRVVDLIEPFKDFSYYHPDQNGSCSIKKVLPVLTDLSYKEMPIGDGGTASREYFRVTYTENNQDKAMVRKNLEKYCGLDTLAMVEIVRKLKELVKR